MKVEIKDELIKRLDAYLSAINYINDPSETGDFKISRQYFIENYLEAYLGGKGY